MGQVARINICVLVLAGIFACCGGGPVWTPTSGTWASQSGSFAASILNVQWLYNTYADGKGLQTGSGGRYTLYRVWFRAYRFSDQKYVYCRAVVHWPGIMAPPPPTVHMEVWAGPPSFPYCWE